MRIPSSFTDENLYRRCGRPSTGASPQRRLLRLLLAMALVIAVMRHAGNPRIYELFFAAPPSSSGAAAMHPVSSSRIVVATSSAATGQPDDTAVQTAVNRTVAALDEATAKRLIAALAAARLDKQATRDATELPADLVAALNQAAGSGDQLAADEGQSQGGAIDWSDAATARRLQAALDRWAIDQVDRAAIWKGSDTLAFYRLLEEPAPPWLRREDAAAAGVISLLQQPEIYLHRRVRLPGSVARAIKRQAVENPFGVSEYWELWLRPRDGSEQPLVFFTADVPKAIAGVGADNSLRDGPPVWIDGIFLKRFAYQSADGRQLAPAIVGSLHPMQVEQLSTAATSVQSVQPSRQPKVWMLIAVSALVGVVITLLIFYQTRRDALRMRALRRSNRLPESVADSFGDASARYSGSGE